MIPFVFDRQYKNHAQVEPFLAGFLVVHAEILAAGQYPYDASFLGRVPGLQGATVRDETSAIYMLQTLKVLREEEAKVGAAIADGCESITEAPATPVKYARIIQYGWYVGGTGWQEYADARLVAFMGDPRSLAVLPKGKRTHGHLLAGKVLVKR